MDVTLHHDDINFRSLTQIIALLHAAKEAAPFRNPVDYIALGLTNYPIVVRKMMDLSTLSNNLQCDRYERARDCLEDLQLIWDNCKLFNEQGSHIYNNCCKLEAYSGRLIESAFEEPFSPKTLYEPSSSAQDWFVVPSDG